MLSYDADLALAGWWSRVGAALIDGLVLVVSLVVIAGVGAALGGAVELVLILAWVAAVIGGYWVYFEGSESGQTPGKHVLGIRVRDEDGGRASYGQAFGRNIVRVLLGILPLIGLLNVLWPLWDRKNQCLHDKAASTVVVRQ
jgi:uncharacterized RDD family membrane protein YckC